MRIVDTNVLVNAHRSDSRSFEEVHQWLRGARSSAEPLGVPSMVESGFLRVVTSRRIFDPPNDVHEALAFLAALERTHNVVRVEPSARHRGIFFELCSSLNARGNSIPDLYLAAIAIEQGATFVTSDRGFLSVPGLRVEDPTAS